ncbi:MAG: triple tyrosine motif-containing protein, partial [Bacteroidota bacterium]
MKLLFSFLFFLCFLYAGFGQFYRQHTTNYTSRDYGKQYSNYTYSIASDDRGFIYAGTASGILQYDGYEWRFIQAKPGVFVTSIAYIRDTLFVGCQGDFGYLAADEKGLYQFISIADSSLEIDVPFTAVWNILATDQGIAFQAEECIFLFSAGQIRQVKPETSFHLAFSANRKLFVRERNIGLCEYVYGGFKPVEHGEMFADTGIFSMIPYQDGLLVVTQEAGIFLWKNNEFNQLLSPELSERFNSALIIGAMPLNDGNYALFSMKDGIFILDSGFSRIIARFSTETGMKSAEVQGIVTDAYGDIWAATLKGICRIQYGSPYSVFSESAGLSGFVQAVSYLKGSYFVGTSGGLYICNNEETVKFTEKKAVIGSIWATTSTNELLFAGGDNGLWMADTNGNMRIISKSPVSALLCIEEEKWIIAAGSAGARIYDERSGRMLKDIPEAASDAHGIAYTKTGNGEYEIWIGSKTQGVIYISTGKTLDYIIDFYQGAPDGLPNDWVCAYQAGEAIWFGTSTGILRFISPAEIAEIAGTPEDASIRGFFDYAGVPSNMSNVSATACSYGDKFSYIALDAGVYKIDMNDLTGSGNDFRNIELGRFNTIFDNDSCLFIGGDDGLAVFDKQKAEHRSGLLPVFGIREIIVGKDSVIWFGDKAFANNELTLPYNMNSITVKLYSLFSDNGFRLQYSWRMEGENDEFSEWNYNHILTFERLREGTYTLQIKAKDSDMDNIAPAELHFRVLP